MNMGSGQGKEKLKEQEINTQKQNLASMKEFLISINSEGGGEDHKNPSDYAEHILQGVYSIQTEFEQKQACANRNTKMEPPNLDSLKQSSLQTEEKQIPSLQCPIHTHRNIELININPSIKQVLFCYECAFEQNIEKGLIKWSDILNDPSIFTKKYNEVNNGEHKASCDFMFNLNFEQVQEDFDYQSQYMLEMKTHLDPYYDEQQQKLDNLKKEYNSFNSIMSGEAEFQKECRNCFFENQNDAQKFEKEIQILMQQQLQKRKSLIDLITCSKIIEQSLIILQDVQTNGIDQLRNLKPFSVVLSEYKQKKALNNTKLMLNKDNL